ncbi:MAG: holo-ACP synthase [Ignavibacteria bacterium]|jgi:holo-[acyl-carrier protein] synthase|nr:holo-ACP synthase [Ignavibacteria bacterium]
MIIGIGTDIIEVARIKKLLVEYGAHSLNKIWTDTEIDYCESFGKRKYEHYAARFAAKEAFSKAIGTGLSNSFAFKDVAVQNLASGNPIIVLNNIMKERWGNYTTHLSIAHTEANAIAYVVIEE